MFTCSVDKGWVVTNDNQWIIPKCKNVGPTKVWIYVGKDYINDGTLNGFPIYGDTCFVVTRVWGWRDPGLSKCHNWILYWRTSLLQSLRY